MSILDAHVHVWDPRTLPYPWLKDVPSLHRTLLPEDIDDADGRIDEWVFVEADAAIEWARDEVAWVSDLEWPGLAGIVAHVDIVGDIARQVDAFAPFPFVRGVRPSLQNEPGDLIESEAFGEGLRRIGSTGLAFDACLRWPQLALFARQAERAPETRIVIDHLGKPPVGDGFRGEAASEWRESIRRLAALPHVSVKCSGLPAEVGGSISRVLDFPAFALDEFGAERAMFGSDWPVSGEPHVGVRVADVVDALRAGASGAEWERLSGATAREFYGISTPHTSDQ